MPDKDWKDQINGSAGSLLDYVLFSAGTFVFLILWGGPLPVWGAAIAGITIGLGMPLFVRFKWPGLYKTSGEKDAEFERARRFGKKR